MKLAHPIAVIFGAGATRGALEKVSDPPPPLDNDFFDIASQLRGHGTPALARRVLKSVWELYRKVSGISLEQYYRDIETRATIGQFAKTANQPKDWTRRRHALEELIRRVYIHTTCDMSGGKAEPRKSDLHKAILSNLGNGDTILTFNYDLVIEESFDLKPSWNPIEGYGDRAQGRTFDWCRNWLTDHKIQDSRKSTKLIILKLHGSLNSFIFDFECIHPFRDGNGRMGRLLTLLLLYQAGYDVGRYISLERIIEDSKETYYEVLLKSSQQWHEAKHNLRPWWNYFLGTLTAAYKEFEERVGKVTTVRGAKREMVQQTIKHLPARFRFSELHRVCPGISYPTLKRALMDLKRSKKVRCLGKGRDAEWERIGSWND